MLVQEECEERLGEADGVIAWELFNRVRVLK